MRTTGVMGRYSIGDLVYFKNPSKSFEENLAVVSGFQDEHGSLQLTLDYAGGDFTTGIMGGIKPFNSEQEVEFLGKYGKVNILKDSTQTVLKAALDAIKDGKIKM